MKMHIVEQKHTHCCLSSNQISWRNWYFVVGEHLHPLGCNTIGFVVGNLETLSTRLCVLAPQAGIR